ncbi:uncharacterized protein IWZ02DRAFT_7105 [Phyllosticta citriasiana]|uniref:uncharacterized protein n=1 Tax=Phyllosticta citriasiana TaxID=595635 RepID=UPI0030FD4EA9
MDGWMDGDRPALMLTDSLTLHHFRHVCAGGGTASPSSVPPLCDTLLVCSVTRLRVDVCPSPPLHSLPDKHHREKQHCQLGSSHRVVLSPTYTSKLPSACPFAVLSVGTLQQHGPCQRRIGPFPVCCTSLQPILSRLRRPLHPSSHLRRTHCNPIHNLPCFSELDMERRCASQLRRRQVGFDRLWIRRGRHLCFGVVAVQVADDHHHDHEDNRTFTS